MKSLINIKSFCILLLLFGIIGITNAQEETKRKVETIEFKVEGRCDMCKKRIENAALIKGVKMAEYNVDNHMLKVVYKASKVDEKSIHDAVAEVGHTTSIAEANEKAYNELPGCCQYKTEGSCEGKHK